MVKKLSILVMLLTILSSNINAQDAGIKFSDNNWEKALEQAKKEKKILFVDAYAEWCGPCKWMAENAFKEEEVGKYFNSNFISIQIDMESDAGKEFNKVYQVTAYPTIFFLDEDGKIIKKNVGAVDGAELLKIAKLAVDPSSTKTFKLKKKITDGDNSTKTINEYILACIEEDMEPDNKILEKYLKSTPSEEIFTPFMVFIKYVDRLDDERSIYFAKNYAMLSGALGKAAEDKFYDLLGKAAEEVKAGKEKRQYIYDFIKYFAGDSDDDYQELKKSIDDFIDGVE